MEKAQNENRRQSSLFSSVCVCLCVNFCVSVWNFFIHGNRVFRVCVRVFVFRVVFKSDVRRVDQNKLLLLLFVLSR
jgi:hypothetical protein